MVDLVKARTRVGTSFERETELTPDALVASAGANVEFMPESALLLADRHQGKLLVFTRNCAVTIPSNLRAGFSCGFMQAGAGAVSFSAGSGTTIRSLGDSKVSAGQWAVGGIASIGPGEFILYGQLA